MTILILSSTEDPASTNIKNYLLKREGWQRYGNLFNHEVYHNQRIDSFLVTIDDRLIRHENVDREVSEELDINLHQLVVISRHRSKTGEPTLTTHPIGNFGEARFGGKDRTFVKSSPRLMTSLLRIIKKYATEYKLYHRVSFEVTHHGPYVEIPTLFVEVGSTEEEWRKTFPAKTIADAVFELLSKYRSEKDLLEDAPVLVGIGGGHYAPRFTDLVFEKNVAFGHMIPSYQIEAEDILWKTFDATPGFKGVYIHRKALKKNVVRWFENFFENNNIKVYRSKDLEDVEKKLPRRTVDSYAKTKNNPRVHHRYPEFYTNETNH